jgi:hypothetical protein
MLVAGKHTAPTDVAANSQATRLAAGLSASAAAARRLAGPASAS